MVPYALQDIKSDYSQILARTMLIFKKLDLRVHCAYNNFTKTQ